MPDKPKKALCVGVNEFAHLPSSSWLNGCVNDARDIAGWLKTRDGFTARNITVLTDADATKAKVMAALTAMVDEAKAGEVGHIVFTFSSHGTQVPDTDGDETADHADEAFACHDIDRKGADWDRDTVIVDDELHALLASIPKDVLVEVMLDTCHSGTGLRDIDLLSGRRPRFLPPPTVKGMRRVAAAKDTQVLRDLVKATPVSTRPVLFAACRSDQTAADAYFDGRYNGAFTYYLLKTLKEAPEATRAAVLSCVSQELRGGDFQQRAQLEAPPKAKRAPFGTLA